MALFTHKQRSKFPDLAGVKLNLDLLPYQAEIRSRNRNGKKEIWCIIRKRWYVLTPEELVRQMLMVYLISSRGYRPALMQVERQIIVHGLKRRFDLMCYNQADDPLLLVECKSASTDLDQSVLEQIANYNYALKVPLLLVCNGHEAYCCQIDHQDTNYTFLEQIPTFNRNATL